MTPTIDDNDGLNVAGSSESWWTRDHIDSELFGQPAEVTLTDIEGA